MSQNSSDVLYARFSNIGEIKRVNKVTLEGFVKFIDDHSLIRTETMNSGDKEKQFEAVVRESHSSLRFFIRSLGVDDAWVDDLAQETFLLAYRKWEFLDDPANAMFWLRRIGR